MAELRARVKEIMSSLGYVELQDNVNHVDYTAKPVKCYRLRSDILQARGPTSIVCDVNNDILNLISLVRYEGKVRFEERSPNETHWIYNEHDHFMGLFSLEKSELPENDSIKWVLDIEKLNL